MRKDFSDTAKETLMKLVKEVEDEQWSTFTDWLGDLLFLYDWDIADYVNDVDNYWKHTIDNENYTAADIERIFAAADAVDAEHGVALQAQIDAVKAQIEYVKSISAAISTPGGMSPSGLQTIVDKTYALADAAVAAYIETLRDQVGVDADGNPIYQYEFDYITTLMLGDPKDLTYQQYLALLTVFEEMDIENKELFIEASYINHTETFSHIGNQTVHVFNWELSPVFQAMAAVSQIELLNVEITLNSLIDSGDPDYLRINNKIFSSSLLVSITQYGQDYTVVVPGTAIPIDPFGIGPKVYVEITEAVVDKIDRLPYDYNISGGGGFGFSVFQYHDDLDKLLDQTVVKDNVERLAPSIGDSVIENVLAIVETAIGFHPRVGNAFSIVFTIGGIGMAILDYYTDNQIANYTYNTLDAGNTAAALFMGGSVTVSQGMFVTSYSVNYAAFDTNALAIAFEVYEEDTGKLLTVDSLVNGTASQADVDAYLSWYASSGSGKVRRAFMERGRE
jgi:hypothetical protein